MFLSYIKILKKRNFSLLWIGQVISQFGDRLTQMALIGLVYRLEPGSSMSLAKILSLAVIPVFIISPVSGAYVDRWSKRKTMCISDFMRGTFILLVSLTFLKFHSMLPVYIFVFLSFCAGRFFIPAKMAMIPSLVDKDELFLANSLVSVTSMIAAVLGFGLGGVIVEKWGVESGFIIDASTFFLSSLLILFMRANDGSAFIPKDILELGREAIKNVKNSLIFEIKDGLKYLFKSSETIYSVKIRVVLFAALGSLYTVFIVFMQKCLNTGTAGLGWLAVAAGLGMFLGTVIYGKVGKYLPVKPAINTSLALCGMHMLAFGFLLKSHPNKILAFAYCLILGILASPIEIALNTLIHKESENAFLGRIFSSLEVILHLAFLVFMFLASFLAELMTPFTIIASVSVMIIVFAVVEMIAGERTGKSDTEKREGAAASVSSGL